MLVVGALHGIGELVVPFLFGICVTLGLFAFIVGFTLAVFNLCLTDEPVSNEPRPRRRMQFSLRHVIAFTTLTAIVCALPNLAKNKETVIGGLAMAFWALLGIAVGFCVLWFVFVGIPMGTVLLARRPWWVGILGLLLQILLYTGFCWIVLYPYPVSALTLYSAAGVGLLFAVPSLGVLRSCGLRLTRHRTAYELARGKER